jgi:hypothetical protein
VIQPSRSTIAVEEAIKRTALRGIALIEAIQRRLIVQATLTSVFVLI